MTQEERLKEISVVLFGTTRSFGELPTRIHTDFRSLVELYRREAIQRKSNKRKRLRPLPQDRQDVVNAILAKLDVKLCKFSSLDAVRQQIFDWYAESQKAFDANSHYNAERAEAYTLVNTVSQERLGRRCAQLADLKNSASSSSKEPLVLDLGCGSGLSMTAAKVNGASFVVGFDLSSAMLDLVDRKSCGDVIRLDLRQKLPFRKEVFDASVSVGAIHFLQEDKPALTQMLSEVRRVSTRPDSPFVSQLFPGKIHGEETPENEVKSLQPYLTAAREVHAEVNTAICLDCTHHTNKRRCYLQIGAGAPNSSTEKCMSLDGRAYCVLQAWGGKNISDWLDEHHWKWARDDHCKEARRMLRIILRRPESAPKVDDTPRWHATCAALRRLFACEASDSETPSLDTIKEKTDEVIRILHGGNE